MNKNKNRLLVQCFMKMLQQRIERDRVENLSPVFVSILSKEELQNILKWLYLDQVPEQYDLETMDKQDLLEAIGDDIHILSYSIERWKKELEEKITPQKVYDVLCQLQLETHYLMTKILADWDEYDHSNFKALCEKAGKEKPLYAIFTSDTLEEDKYITPPFSRYHKTEWEAREELAEFFSEGGIAENELKIMSL
ncbi:hypothetical protein HNP38_002406 [Chryseobacterium defluvii]|uniref:Uncharacterized protein n=1 Tax=Chryseobacterium defluvii TaxID=160396 RepID=A0A840KJP9_9FLAO|nr:hypothetical protein [Chryseobacterium defluvii]MBB4807102.1 hypothetical protein [Chryseobacterium defluvii]